MKQLLGCAAGLALLVMQVAAGPDPFSRQVLDGINAERIKRNLPAVVWDQRLGQMTSEWAIQLAANGGDLEHREDLLERGRDLGFGYMNENLYFSSSEPVAVRVVQQWMKSPGHCKNLLNPSIGWLGLGRARGRDGWVVVFNGAALTPP